MPKLDVLPKELIGYKAGVADPAKLFLVTLPKERNSIIPRLDPRSKNAENLSTANDE